MGFDTSVGQGVVSASVERPTFALEVTVAKEGEVFVSKTLREETSNEDFGLSFHKSQVFVTKEQIYEVRTEIKNVAQLKEVINKIISYNTDYS